MLSQAVIDAVREAVATEFAPVKEFIKQAVADREKPVRHLTNEDLAKRWGGLSHQGLRDRKALPGFPKPVFPGAGRQIYRVEDIEQFEESLRWPS